MIRRLIYALVAGLLLGVTLGAQPAQALTSGDYFVARNVSSGNYDVTVRYGDTSANYCEMFITNDAFDHGRYGLQLETSTGITLDQGPVLFIDRGDYGHWTIEPGAARPHSEKARVEVSVAYWSGGADGHWVFWHLMHIGVYDASTYDTRRRIGPVGSQTTWQGC